MNEKPQCFRHDGERWHRGRVGRRRDLDREELPRQREEENPERARGPVGRLARVEGEPLSLNEVLREHEMNERVVGEVVEKRSERRGGGDEEEQEKRARGRGHVSLTPARGSVARVP